MAKAIERPNDARPVSTKMGLKNESKMTVVVAKVVASIEIIWRLDIFSDLNVNETQTAQIAPPVIAKLAIRSSWTVIDGSDSIGELKPCTVVRNDFKILTKDVSKKYVELGSDGSANLIENALIRVHMICPRNNVNAFKNNLFSSIQTKTTVAKIMIGIKAS